MQLASRNAFSEYGEGGFCVPGTLCVWYVVVARDVGYLTRPRVFFLVKPFDDFWLFPLAAFVETPVIIFLISTSLYHLVVLLGWVVVSMYVLLSVLVCSSRFVVS